MSHVDKSIEGSESQGAVVAVRTSRYKLIRDQEKDRGELFDLATDPAESQNVSGSHPNVVKRLQRVIDERSQEMPTPRPTKQGAVPDPATVERLRALGYGG
jgi:hypothetical protein